MTILSIVLAAASAMTLQSADFPAGGTIPPAFMSADCGGKNRTPELHWKGAPDGTKSFALVVHDSDAPIAGGFYHWVVYDIPAGAHGLSSPASQSGMKTGLSSTGQAAYYGPCPPEGPAHHYLFTLYALDVARVSADSPLTAVELQQRIDRHVLARATLAVTAARNPAGS